MNVLVDTSVWIDLFADRDTPETTCGRALLVAEHALMTGDVILTEVLQGTRDRADHDRKLDVLDQFDSITIVDRAVAIEAAINYRRLRALGITVRKTIDTLIATRCILDRIPLLYADRDFDPFVAHLGLRSALDLKEAI